MGTFQYRGFRNSGRACAGLVEALDLKEAREKLAHQGILAERVDATGSRARIARRGRSGRGFDTDTRGMVYRELAALLGSGLPLEKGLDVLIDAPELGSSRGILAAVRDGIREGSSIAAAFAENSEEVRSFEEAVLQVGERVGTLDTILVDLADFLEEQQRIRETVQTALIYPAMVATLAIGIAIVALGVMVPSISGLLQEARIPLPWITRVAMLTGKAVLWVGVPALLALGFAAAWFRRKWKRDRDWRAKADAFLFRIPAVRSGYASLVNFRFARTLSLLLNGGVSLVGGVELAGKATDSPWIEERVSREADDLRHGRSLADVIRRIPPLSISLSGWIQAGEASGNLARLLGSAAERYRYRWERFMNRSLSVLGPALILVVGLFVLLVALAVLLPVLSLNQTLL